MIPSDPDINNDPVWSAAWTWVRRQHDGDGLCEEEQRQLIGWLGQNPQNRKAYDRAAKLWLLSGLVPPANDIPIPDSCDAPTLDPDARDTKG